MTETTRCGFIAIIGRPNVGKSTLLNAILAKKLSITSDKPQTTRHRITGIKTQDKAQLIFVDTPGLHNHEGRVLNRYMNRSAKSALADVDIVLFVVAALQWTESDEAVLRLLTHVNKPVILAINKIDKIHTMEKLLPFIESISSKFNFAKIIPISAQKGTQLTDLENILIDQLPESPFFYEPEQVTDRTDAFITSEIIREKLTRMLGQELPYALTVGIEAFEHQDGILKISAVIWVERAGQKAIVIGKDGESLKLIGQKARHDLERHFGCKVFLKLWVKVKTNWADNEQLLNHLGYGE